MAGLGFVRPSADWYLTSQLKINEIKQISSQTKFAN